MHASVANTDAPVNRFLAALPEAMATMSASLATLACTYAIDPEPGPCVLAVVSCLALARSQLDRDLRGRLEAGLAMPLVGLAAMGVAMSLHHARWWGALAFVIGMAMPIWLRRFGPRVRRGGSLLGLPLLVVLTTPYAPPRHASPVMLVVLPLLVPLLAWVWVTAIHLSARRIGVLQVSAVEPSHVPARPPAGPARLAASTRMAIQMAVALATAFVLGYLLFPRHWSWIVLTAYIVLSGNRGRLEVAYKSGQRFLGAAAGTLLASVFAVHVGGHAVATVALMLTALFAGLCLRPLGYGWWALCVTLVLAMLQGFEGMTGSGLLWPRLEEIAIGALIGLASAWFVLPVRSTDVLRRRIADALAVLGAAFDPEPPVHARAAVLSAFGQVAQLAPAFRALQPIARRFHRDQPAQWIDTLLACRGSAVQLITQGTVPGSLRRNLGDARKALREPEHILDALRALRDALQRACSVHPPASAYTPVAPGPDGVDGA